MYIKKIKKTNLFESVSKFRKLGKTMGYWKHGYALENNCKQVFRMTDFSGQKLLEIGCGTGIYCIWAGIWGAAHALGLEPFEDGSSSLSSSLFENFKNIAAKLKLNNVEIIPKMIQEYECEDGVFNLVISVNSINHFDEMNCIRLRKSVQAREAYLNIFKKIKKIMANNSKVIIIDVSRNNYFGNRNLKNPFVKNIDWFKHHEPEFWAELLSVCGFKDPKISWNSGKLLRYLGIMSISKKLAYFMNSSFRLEMTLEK